MATNVYSWTFLVQHDLDGSSATFGPLPGYVAVVKGVDAVLGTLDIGNIQLLGAAGQVVWQDGAATPGLHYFSYRGGYVLFPDTEAWIETTAAMDVSVWGYMLAGPPPS